MKLKLRMMRIMMNPRMKLFLYRLKITQKNKIKFTLLSFDFNCVLRTMCEIFKYIS